MKASDSETSLESIITDSGIKAEKEELQSQDNVRGQQEAVITNQDATLSKTSSRGKSSLQRRQVSFHQVEIRRYYLTLGDNPSCSVGTPVGLDWKYESLPPLSLDDYEEARRSTRKRHVRQLVLSYFDRRAILERQGFTALDLKRCTKEITRIQWQRYQTVMMLPVRKLEEIAQSARRKVKRRWSGGSVQSGGIPITATNEKKELRLPVLVADA